MASGKGRASRLRREGVERGILGDNYAWTAIAAATWALRGYQIASRRDEQIVVEELQPGEELIVSHHPPAYGRAGRKARRKLAKAQHETEKLSAGTRRERRSVRKLERKRRQAFRSRSARQARELTKVAERAEARTDRGRQAKRARRASDVSPHARFS